MDRSVICVHRCRVGEDWTGTVEWESFFFKYKSILSWQLSVPGACLFRTSPCGVRRTLHVSCSAETQKKNKYANKDAATRTEPLEKEPLKEPPC
jgi:hypothetical protein